MHNGNKYIPDDYLAKAGAEYDAAGLEANCEHEECHAHFVSEVRRTSFERASSDILCLVDERAEDAHFFECERREEWRTAQR